MYDNRIFTVMKASRSKYVAVALIFSFLLFYSPHLLLAQAVGHGILAGFIYGEDGVTPVEGAIVKIKDIVDGTIYESHQSDSQGAFKIEGIKEGLYSVGISISTGDFNFENLVGIRQGEPAKISFSLAATRAQSTSLFLAATRALSTSLPEEKSTPDPEEKTASTVEGQTSPPIQAGTEVTAPAEAVFLGKVVNYNFKTQVVSIFIEEGILRIGDKLIFRGATTNFSQNVESIKIGSTNIEKATAGQTPDVKIDQPTKVGDFVYLGVKRKAFFFFSPIGVATVLAATAGVVYGVVRLTEEEAEVSAFKK